MADANPKTSLPDESFHEIRPYDTDRSEWMFTLRNPLSLFYPYMTSDDDLHITADMQTSFDRKVELNDLKGTIGLIGPTDARKPESYPDR